MLPVINTAESIEKSMTIKQLTIILICAVSACGSAQITDGWQIIDEMPLPVTGGRAFYYEGKILVFGGYSDSTESPVDWVQQYDPSADSTERWKLVGHLSVGRSFFTADIYKDVFYLFGGQTGYDEKTVVSIDGWNRQNDATTVVFDTTVNRIYACGGISGDRMYVFGGYSSYESILPYSAVYDLNRLTLAQTRDWFAHESPYQQSSALFGDYFYIFGGVRNGILSEVFRYDTVSDVFEQVFPAMQRPRAASAAVTVSANRTIYVIGGYNESRSAMKLVECFKIDNDGYSVQEMPSLNHARREHMAVYIPDFSLIYVFGGRNERGDVCNTVERLKIETFATPVNNRGLFSDYDLHDNYPNPFNSATWISFSLDEMSKITLAVYSIDGTLVKTLTTGFFPVGTFQFRWDGTDENGKPLPSGTFIYRLQKSGNYMSKKMLLLK